MLISEMLSLHFTDVNVIILDVYYAYRQRLHF